MKNLIICSDGTWNRPEQLGKKDQYPTNVLRFARGIAPRDENDHKQVVFYDWGIGSYHDNLTGGALGAGLEKNVMDAYRFLVHNYEPGDRIYLFGFSRGAYTVRSLCGMLNNCHILKSENAYMVEEGFKLYKTRVHKPNGDFSKMWKNKHAVPNSGHVHFVGVWDTVGAMGLPFSFFGLLKDKHLFYDHKLGSNIGTARHAMSLDETRDDFKPTIWEPRPEVDLKQVWFAGVHADVGGSYPPDNDGSFLSDIPMMWMLREAEQQGLSFDAFLNVPFVNPLSEKHNEYKRLYKLLGRHKRIIPPQDRIPTSVHSSVRQRYENSDYTSEAIAHFENVHGHWPQVEGGGASFDK